jgi:hypothetical protein
MHRRAAGQDRPGRLRRGVGMAVPVAKGNHPAIILHQEIENRPLEVGIRRASAQIGQTCSGCIEEGREDFVLGRKPAQSLKREDLSGFLLHFGGVLCLFCPVFTANR